MPQFPEYPVPHRGIEQHVHVPPMVPMNIPVEISEIPYPTTGQPARFPLAPHQIMLRQMIPHAETLIAASDRLYYAPYNRMLEAHCCNACPPPFVQRSFVPVPTYTAQETPVVTEEIFNPVVTPEMVNAGPASPVYHNQQHVDPLSDAVWAPNPGEIFSPRSLPPVPVSPVESTWSRDYRASSAINPAGTNGVPAAPTTADGSKVPMVLVRKQPRGNERAAKGYQVSELDDQELEASLQALERRIDTELFKNVD